MTFFCTLVVKYRRSCYQLRTFFRTASSRKFKAQDSMCAYFYPYKTNCITISCDATARGTNLESVNEGEAREKKFSFSLFPHALWFGNLLCTVNKPVITTGFWLST